MLNADDLLILIKKAAKEAVDASQPSDFCFGKVISVSPLKIRVEQKMILGDAQLILTRNVTNFSTKVTISDEQPWSTENESGGSGDSSFASHNHSIVGTKTLTINNALQMGDEVILLKRKGGQKFLVLDRVVNT